MCGKIVCPFIPRLTSPCGMRMRLQLPEPICASSAGLRPPLPIRLYTQRVAINAVGFKNFTEAVVGGVYATVKITPVVGGTVSCSSRCSDFSRAAGHWLAVRLHVFQWLLRQFRVASAVHKLLPGPVLPPLSSMTNWTTILTSSRGSMPKWSPNFHRSGALAPVM